MSKKRKNSGEVPVNPAVARSAICGPLRSVYRLVLWLGSGVPGRLVTVHVLIILVVR